MKDTDIMPFGKYMGQKMANVPADYLIWLYENNKCNFGVRQYVRDNLKDLKAEANKNKK